jgi:hypothetical protein
MLPGPETPEPMEAKPVTKLPAGDGWLYEPKRDGYRSLAFRDGRTCQRARWRPGLWRTSMWHREATFLCGLQVRLRSPILKRPPPVTLDATWGRDALSAQ